MQASASTVAWTIARTGEVLAELDPDVDALQEVISAPGTETGDQVAALADRVGMTPILGMATCRGIGSYGNAILTRLPVRDASSVDIAILGHEPRCLMGVGLEHRDGYALRVMSTHLGVRVRERHAQLARCARLFAAGDDTRPLLVMGDFDSWLPRGDVSSELRKHLGSQLAPRSFPARRPIFALDRLWSRPSAHAFTGGTRTP